MYRPQFAFKTPPGCRDEDFTYFFNGQNTKLLATSVASRTITDIPLLLEQDASFYWRGIKLGFIDTTGENGGAGSVNNWTRPEVYVKFQDPYQNNLSDGLVPAMEYGYPQNSLDFLGSRLTGAPMPLDPEIRCPAGSYILLDLKGTADAIGLLTVALYGVKRFKECG